MRYDVYESPFVSRWSSSEMLYLFSANKKFTTWRRLWIALARAEKKLGLPFTDEQIDEMEQYKDQINYDVAEAAEKELRHDVFAHIRAYGEQCPKAAPIIHTGATSCYVGDNTDIIIMKEGLLLIKTRILSVMQRLSDFADRYKSMPTLAYTHFQVAQPTTVGKRATLWINDLLHDLDELEFRLSTLKLRGVKGTTGTQASFMELFDGDHEKVKQLEKMVAAEMGFEACEPVTGQTYTRKVDSQILATLSGIAQSASKFATDLRLLQHLKEIEEPFETQQVGSSAMPYKRNPMRSERICGLARFVIADVLNADVTAATQWFERTLDDSSNRRLSIPEAFLAVDAILLLYENIVSGLVVYPEMIRRHIEEELPFNAVENIMMRAVKKGGDRQKLHERIRVHSMEAGRQVKELGLKNDLVSRIASDPVFNLTEEEILAELKPELYIGRSEQQTTDFLDNLVRPRIPAKTAESAKHEKPSSGLKV